MNISFLCSIVDMDSDSDVAWSLLVGCSILILSLVYTLLVLSWRMLVGVAIRGDIEWQLNALALAKWTLRWRLRLLISYPP